jgi:hypothetical protein
MILGWIRVDRMMVVCWKMSIDVIFDINEYGGLSLLLENDLENVPCHSLGYINVGGGWGYRGIVGKKSPRF